MSTHPNRRHRILPPAPRAALPSRLRWAALAVLGLMMLSGLVDPARASACAGLSTSQMEAGSPNDARSEILGLVKRAQQRSQALGAAKLLADAAQMDVQEVEASGKPQLSANLSLGPVWTKQENIEARKGLQLRPGLNFSWSFYDSGRLQHLTHWRQQLANAAMAGQLSQAEQVALQTVSLSLDRSRYKLQVQVWQQYASKVCKLVDALDQIVVADKGRASELAQARKQLQQVLLSQAQARTQLGLAETRLKRLVGEELPDAPSLATLLPSSPDLLEVQARATRSADILMLEAQARAADSLAQAAVSAQKLQAGWTINASGAAGKDKSAMVTAGLSVSMPVLNPGGEPAVQAARLRAEAAKLQREEALDALRGRLAEVHQQAAAASVRARDVMGALKLSERVREDTLAQWQQLGKRSLFDVISAEGDHFGLRLAYVDALHDTQQSAALLWSLGGGVSTPLE